MACQEPLDSGPGTNLEHLVVGVDGDVVTVRAQYDGPVQAPVQLRDGDVSGLLSVYLSNDTADDPAPYAVLIGAGGLVGGAGEYGAQAGRIGGGFVDATWVNLTNGADNFTIEVDTTGFADLDAGVPVTVWAESTVQEFRSRPDELGWVALGSQWCSPHYDPDPAGQPDPEALAGDPTGPDDEAAGEGGGDEPGDPASPDQGSPSVAQQSVTAFWDAMLVADLPVAYTYATTDAVDFFILELPEPADDYRPGECWDMELGTSPIEGAVVVCEYLGQWSFLQMYVSAANPPVVLDVYPNFFE